MAENMVKKENSHRKCEAVIVRPAADVADEKDGVEICFELPGSSADDISLEIRDKLLTLKACSTLHRRGMPVVYKRSFYLSDAVDTENITANAADGLLTLFLPKAESARSHRIKVNMGDEKQK